MSILVLLVRESAGLVHDLCAFDFYERVVHADQLPGVDVVEAEHQHVFVKKGFKPFAVYFDYGCDFLQNFLKLCLSAVVLRYPRIQ